MAAWIDSLTASRTQMLPSLIIWRCFVRQVNSVSLVSGVFFFFSLSHFSACISLMWCDFSLNNEAQSLLLFVYFDNERWLFRSIKGNNSEFISRSRASELWAQIHRSMRVFRVCTLGVWLYRSLVVWGLPACQEQQSQTRNWCSWQGCHDFHSESLPLNPGIFIWNCLTLSHEKPKVCLCF